MIHKGPENSIVVGITDAGSVAGLWLNLNRVTAGQTKMFK